MAVTPADDKLSATTIQRLLAVNRAFYATVSTEFDKSRASIPQGMHDALALLELPLRPKPVRVLDAGCGNGRLARALDEIGVPIQYVGLDADPALLGAARAQTADLSHVQASFVEGDLLASPLLPSPVTQFDVVACMAALHHIPGEGLRARVLRNLVDLLAPGGRLLISTWQFMSSSRLAARVQPWEAIGLRATDVAPGDYLLPWDQGVHALRYVHLIDVAEIRVLARTANLEVGRIFYADGKEGNLNLYATFSRTDPVQDIAP